MALSKGSWEMQLSSMLVWASHHFLATSSTVSKYIWSVKFDIVLWCLPQFSCLFFFYQHRTDAAPDVEDADVCQFQNNSRLLSLRRNVVSLPKTFKFFSPALYMTWKSHLIKWKAVAFLVTTERQKKSCIINMQIYKSMLHILSLQKKSIY